MRETGLKYLKCDGAVCIFTEVRNLYARGSRTIPKGSRIIRFQILPYKIDYEKIFN